MHLFIKLTMVLRSFGELLFSRAIIWHLLKTFWFTSPKTLTGGNWHRHSNSGLPFFLIWSLPRLWYGSLYMFSLIPPLIYMWVSVCTLMYIYLFSCPSVPAPQLLIFHREYLVWCIVVVYQSYLLFVYALLGPWFG
jgi:hypothetical protein